MNGYPYQARAGVPDERQPPSIPPLSQLAFNRPAADASPSPSHLPPLAQHNYAPPYPQTNGQRPADKNGLAQLAPNGAPQSSYPVPGQYPQPQGYPPTSGAPGQAANGPYYAPNSQPPPFVEPGHQPNLLPPFNPQQAQGQTQPQPAATQTQTDRPVPVVGSQGRRGILPSAPGRAQAGGTTPTPKDGINPICRRADGKFECQFCNKSYLHLKHLKRHHLRHTGERPYQCYLCQETFCRSDILKRHFQKCSLRRGNPTGVTHLTHAQAHLRRGSHQTPPQPTAQNGNGPAAFRPNWPAGVANEQVGDSNRSSRSSSVVHRPGSSTDERKAANSQTANTSLDTSPQSNQEERNKQAQYYRETGGPYDHAQPPASQAGQQPGQYPYYPPQFNGTSQAESFPNFNNYQNGYRYPQSTEQQPSYPDQPYNPYTQFFQPGSNDPVLSYHHQ